MSADAPAPETPDETIDQDPGIPGFDTVTERPASRPAEEKDSEAERRERVDDADDEGHLSADGPS